MDNQARIVIITSDQLRHRYFCKELSLNLNLVGIVAETKSVSTNDFSKFSFPDQRLIKKHFDERDEVEKEMLGHFIDFPEVDRLMIKFGELNSLSVYNWVLEHNPDLILLYGSGIVKNPILSFYENRIINLHLGLSPYYRGSGTNFWPLVFEQPECVGATIHLAINKVDAGSILHQLRPEIEKNDRVHEIGTKTIIKATKEISTVLKKYLSNPGQVQPVIQDQGIGKIFKNKDFNAEVLKRVWYNFDNGMIDKFLIHSKSRYDQFPIVEINL
jgi:hypothetical protein